MKNIVFLILCVPTILLCQNQKQNLYIFYDDCSIHKISKIHSDTLDQEIYQIRFGDKIKPERKFTLSDSGGLKKHIALSGKSYPYLSIVYINRNNNNQAIQINVEDIENQIWAENIIYAVETDFSVLFKKFKNIYLVDLNDKESDIRLAKKVEVKYISAL